ncbi:PREDICTED: nucleoside diphosphate-linked moiety X motif 19 [Gekko japonicus]|uniref:Nucleoside diphosphate-linked moiety X motif 19 n=1 Tax=Gekko japonicus TaxID=146911 RepID=A0ABM1K9C0_GEKJA|nr:PREDICTED: nucleoside diphosphate-linked moiety X motif 19 [Gekko japonicus]
MRPTSDSPSHRQEIDGDFAGMNSRLRHWREAATVLLTAGGVGPGPAAPGVGTGARRRPGSSSSSSPSFDYHVLLLRRSPRSAFMPSAHVFPGGVPGPLPPAPELAEWRLRVQRQPACFLQLCRHLRCVPNIWALHEWSNWLTPVGRGRRYDTAFYLCCLGQGPPPASHDQVEVTACQWTEPPEAIELVKSQDIWIPPPQFYELCRLCNFPSLHDLHRFGFERAAEGCERWMCVLLTASDGYMQLLPGDELYPEDPDFTGERKPALSTNKKIEDVLKEATRLHRIVIRDLNNVTVHVNIPPKYKHINPLPLNSKMGNTSNCGSRL